MKRISLMMALIISSPPAADERPFSLAEEPPVINSLFPRPRRGGECQEEGAICSHDVPAPRRIQWLMFTARWCPACQAARADFEPWMTRSGWRISDEVDAHLRLIDGDLHPELVHDYGIASYPTFLLLHDGREEFRSTGYPGRSQLVQRYLALDSRKSTPPHPAEVRWSVE